MKVEVFIPCYIDQIFPQTAFNMVRVLEAAGCQVYYNPEQTCCGQPPYNAGYFDEAKVVGEKLLKEVTPGRTLVIPSASCTGMIRNAYSPLFHNSVLHNQCKQVQKNTFEFTEFLVNVLKKPDLGARFPARVTYHDSCSGIRECKITQPPRMLLQHIEGLELVEMKHTDVCCGFGGSFAVKFEPLSVAMTEEKVRHALDTGAEYLVSTDSSCLMQIQSYLDKNQVPLKTLHIADLLAMGLQQPA